jgi:hypothetical protein
MLRSLLFYGSEAAQHLTRPWGCALTKYNYSKIRRRIWTFTRRDLNVLLVKIATKRLAPAA